MAVSAFATGTTTPTVGAENFLSSPNVVGTFTFHIDTVNMVAGDVLEIRVYQIIITGGTTRVAYLQRYADAQSVDDLIKISVPISNDLTDTNSLRFSINQTKGTQRAFPWKVLKYA